MRFLILIGFIFTLAICGTVVVGVSTRRWQVWDPFVKMLWTSAIAVVLWAVVASQTSGFLDVLAFYGGIAAVLCIVWKVAKSLAGGYRDRLSSVKETRNGDDDTNG